MTNSTADYARELLTLEKDYRDGTFDQARASRWNELVTLIFGDDESKHPRPRRSFRLPMQVGTSFKLGRATFECVITEAARIGLTMTGPVLAHLMHEDTIELANITGPRPIADLNLLVDIVRLDLGKKTGPIAGVLIAATNTPEARRRYFDEFYYPHYIDYLRQLAG